MHYIKYDAHVPEDGAKLIDDTVLSLEIQYHSDGPKTQGGFQERLISPMGQGRGFDLQYVEVWERRIDQRQSQK